MTDNVRYLASSTLPDREDRDWVTSVELIDEAGISYRQLDYWARTELVHPIEHHNPGSGHLRRFRADQVERARALSDLLAVGVSLQFCRLVIDDITATGVATVGPITIHRHSPGDAA